VENNTKNRKSRRAAGDRQKDSEEMGHKSRRDGEKDTARGERRDGRKDGATGGRQGGEKNLLRGEQPAGKKQNRGSENRNWTVKKENKTGGVKDRQKVISRDRPSADKVWSRKEQDGVRQPAKKEKSLCPVSKKCGGCQLLDIPYERQLYGKQKQVEQLLKGVCRVYPITGMEEPFHYRNKVHAVFGYQKGQAISGIYQEGTHDIVAVEKCMLEDEKADEIIGTIRGLLKSFKIRTYDEDSGFGFLRHVLVKRGFATGQIMVVLVTASPIFPSKNHFVKALTDRHPEITTIIQNMNDRQTSMVLGEREKVLYGKGYIEDVLCGCTFRISSRSFYQVNPVQTEKLYAKAIEAAGLTGKETVIDAYCGIGTIGIIAAGKAGKVIGVELNQDAVRDAVRNARTNKTDQIQFYCNDAGRFMAGMARDGEKADVVFMDPPRSGSTEEFLDAVALLGPERVVYVSCNPETLARDLKVLTGRGYRAVGAWPFDLFPHTGHVETIVLLSKGEVDSKKIRVEFSLEDMDMSEFQDGATYPQIKEYVLEHTGLKVSNLYISQIKRKCGIEVGKNYNLPKAEDSRQPQCPPEKEKAIREAFKYFGMI
jgi:23S rRNA (uracil1939-C5)-methyltransferase